MGDIGRSFFYWDFSGFVANVAGIFFFVIMLNLTLFSSDCISELIKLQCL